MIPWQQHIDDFAAAIGVPAGSRSMMLVQRWRGERASQPAVLTYIDADGDRRSSAVDDDMVERLAQDFGVPSTAYEMALSYDWQERNCVPILVVKSEASDEKSYLNAIASLKEKSHE